MVKKMAEKGWEWRQLNCNSGWKHQTWRTAQDRVIKGYKSQHWSDLIYFKQNKSHSRSWSPWQMWWKNIGSLIKIRHALVRGFIWSDISIRWEFVSKGCSSHTIKSRLNPYLMKCLHCFMVCIYWFSITYNIAVCFFVFLKSRKWWTAMLGCETSPPVTCSSHQYSLYSYTDSHDSVSDASSRDDETTAKDQLKSRDAAKHTDLPMWGAATGSWLINRTWSAAGRCSFDGCFNPGWQYHQEERA